MSVVGILRKVYEYFKNRMVGTIDLNMFKINVAFGDLVGWRKRVYEFFLKLILKKCNYWICILL